MLENYFHEEDGENWKGQCTACLCDAVMFRNTIPPCSGQDAGTLLSLSSASSGRTLSSKRIRRAIAPRDVSNEVQLLIRRIMYVLSAAVAIRFSIVA
jgi:hypothetical protein